MNKERFLMEIRQDACCAGSRAAIAWEAAVKLPDSDQRWNEIEEHDMVGTFGKAFGVELPPMATGRRRGSRVERLERQIAEAIEHKAEASHIKHLERQLEQARKLER